MSSSYKKRNKKKALEKKIKNNKYYYVFVAIMLIIVILVTVLDYKYRFGLIKWNEILGESSEKESSGDPEHVTVDKIGNLVVKFIDVGQGDAILINFPDGKNMLIDAGENNDETENALDEALKDEKGDKIVLDYVVATHTDSDHIGSIDYVYENYTVKKSYRPYAKSTHGDATGFKDSFNDGSIDKDTKVYYNYIKGVYDEKTEWEFFTDASDFAPTVVTSNGDSYTYKVEFLMPHVKTLNDFSKFKDTNDCSAVILVEFAGKKILFTGDMEEKAEDAFVEYYSNNKSEIYDIDCDVLKVGHHGSATSSTSPFLNLIKPEHAVISCGINNKHEHPRTQALDNILAIQSTLNYDNDEKNKGIYRTDLQGTVVLTVTPQGEMTFTTEISKFDKYLLLDFYELEEYADEIEAYKENL